MDGMDSGNYEEDDRRMARRMVILQVMRNE
jgi:hypothetical protein